MERRGFALSEIILAASISGLVFAVIGYMWFFLTKSLASEGRLEEVRQEVVMIMSQLDKDIGYEAIGSKRNPGISVCGKADCGAHPCPADGTGILSFRKDSNNNFKPDDRDMWVDYKFSNHRLERCEGTRCVLISDKVQSIDVTPVPSGSACGNFFMVSVHLICRYFPGEDVSANNPQVDVRFTLSANQVSVR